MFACAFILIVLLPVAFLPLLETLFSARELTEMGIRLERPWECSQAGDPLQIT